MSEVNQQLRDARRHLRPADWSPARSHQVLSRIIQRKRRFDLSTVALASAAVTVAVVVAMFLSARGEVAHSKTAKNSEQHLQLADGTRAIALGDTSSVRLVKENDSLVSFSLDSGKGWFDVTPSGTRTVEVVAKDVHVQVLGTEFVVEIQGDVVHVWVQRGKVLVTSSEGKVELTKGDHARFPSRADETDETPVGPDELVEVDEDGFDDEEGFDDEVDATIEIREPPKHDTPPAKGTEKQEATKPQPPAVDPIATLWKDADEARIRNDFAAAHVALTQLLSDYPDDPRAALAAFTLGRVLMKTDQSDRVVARAFAKARKLAPNGPLVEDALLHEIEAWARDGDERRARKRSEKYLRLFPEGRYRQKVNAMRMGE